MDEIVIRQATLDDRKRVEKCVRAIGKFVKTYFDMRSTEDYYNNGFVWLAEIPGEDTVLGFAVCPLLKRSFVASLYEMGVLPELQGLGLGERLIRTASCGRPLRLVVDHDNPAVAFYQRLGLESTTPEPYLTRSGKNRVYKFEGELK